jgi:hypothetical protein
MKKLLILPLICAAVYFVGQNLGWFNSTNSEAIAAYKQFMDRWIVRDYTGAQPYAIGDAAAAVEEAESKTKMQFMGRTINIPLASDKGDVGGSRIKVVSETQSDDGIYFELLYSASVSLPGSFSNPMSPDSWSVYKQEATMEQVGSAWKVASFSSELLEDE